MRFLPLFLVLFFCAFLPGEKPVLLKKIEAFGALFTTDPMDNLYIVQQERIDKYDRSGNLLKNFSDKTLGEISSADVSNPLRLVLFYRDFSQVVFLDNTMTLSGGPINLQKLGYPQATLIGNSYDNALWLYDQQNFELLRLDNGLQVNQRTGNLGQQLNIELQPNFLIEVNNKVYLNNPATGILVFDVFGTYHKTIPIKGLQDLQVRGDKLMYSKNSGKLFSYEFKSGETDSLSGIPAPVKSMRLGKERLFVHKGDTISVYEMKQP